MHSSRMRTARFSDLLYWGEVSASGSGGGGLPLGPGGGGVSASGSGHSLFAGGKNEC